MYIRRPDSDGKEEERLAEVLSIRDKPVSIYQPQTTNTTDTNPEDQYEYFVHWESFNKRLDEWISGSRIVFTRNLEQPAPKTPGRKNNTSTKVPGKKPRPNLLKKATSNAANLGLSSSVPGTPQASPSSASLKRKAPHDEMEEEEEAVGSDADGDADMDVDGDGEVETIGADDIEGLPDPGPSTFSKEQEIEKLRTSGSMTQSISEIARVKNLNRIQIGKHEVEAWYFSPYPKEYAHLPVLYICEFCLCYFPSPMMISRHRRRCTLLHPPGNEIYRHEDISFFEIDGKRQLTWCRNLSLLSKCFLDQYVHSTPCKVILSLNFT